MNSWELLQRSLPVLQRLARSAAGACTSTSPSSSSSWAASTSGRGSIIALQHCYSTASSAAVPSASSTSLPDAAAAQLPSFWPQPPPRAATTASALPAPHVYDLRIVIKGYELRYVQQASTVVRDLLLLHTAPKSASVLPPAIQAPPDPIHNKSPTTPAHLALPIGDVSTRKQRTLYTVIRSPHKYKSSREQFERIVHRRLVRHSTVSHWELQWILDSLQMYDFTGVQIAVRTTTPTYLQPALQAPAEPLLAAHRRHFAQDFALPGTATGSGSSITTTSSSSSSSRRRDDSLSASSSFAALRTAVRSLIRDQRLELHSSPNYQEWLAKERRSGGAAAGIAAGAAWAAQQPGALEKAIESLLEQRPELVARAAGEAHGVGGAVAGKDLFLEAAREVLMELDLEQLQRHELFPAAMAHYPLGAKDAPPAAEWIYAMLKFSLYRQRLANRTSASPQALQQAFAQYGDFAGAMVALLLQRWYDRAATGARGQLGVPDGRSTSDMLSRLQTLSSREQGSGYGGSAGGDRDDGGWRREQRS